MIKKRIISIMVLLVLLTSLLMTFVGCESQQSIKVPEVKQDVYVYDQDDCINDEIEAEINYLLKELEGKTQAEFAVISIPSLNNYTIEEYANELFNKLGIGKDDQDNGVLLLFSKTDKKVRLEIGRGLEGCLNDAKCGRILDEHFVPYREEGDYTKASRQTVMAVLTVIAEEYQVNLENLEQIETVEEDEEDMPWWGYLLIIILIVVVGCIKASVDDESSGGGYYGGFSSGGGFRSGGFGGGRSGGGGASR
ncbi:MAG: TPM domain-containing protein [Clostridia bacterium]|nr:TPM domain-containing protein [Clostridia bacterium]